MNKGALFIVSTLALLSVVGAVSLRTATGAAAEFKAGSCKQACVAHFQLFLAENPESFHYKLCAVGSEYSDEAGSLITAGEMVEGVKEEADWMPDDCQQALEGDDDAAVAEVNECHQWIKTSCEEEETNRGEACVTACSDQLLETIADHGSDIVPRVRTMVCDVDGDAESEIFDEIFSSVDKEGQGHLSKLCQGNKAAAHGCKEQICNVELKASGCADACAEHYKNMAYGDHTGEGLRDLHAHLCTEKRKVEVDVEADYWVEAASLNVRVCSHENSEEQQAYVDTCNEELQAEFCRDDFDVDSKVGALAKVHEEYNRCVPMCIRSVERMHAEYPEGFKEEFCNIPEDDVARKIIGRRGKIWEDNDACSVEGFQMIADAGECAVRVQELCTGKKAWDGSECVPQCEASMKGLRDENARYFSDEVCADGGKDFLSRNLNKVFQDGRCAGGYPSEIKARLEACAEATRPLCSECTDKCTEWLTLGKEEEPEEFAEHMCPAETADKKAKLEENTDKFWEDDERLRPFCEARREEAIGGCLQTLEQLCQ